MKTKCFACGWEIEVNFVPPAGGQPMTGNVCPYCGKSAFELKIERSLGTIADL